MRFLVLIFALLFMGCDEKDKVNTLEGVVVNVELGGFDYPSQGATVTFEDGRIVVLIFDLHRRRPLVIKNGKYNIFELHRNSGNVVSIRQR